LFGVAEGFVVLVAAAPSATIPSPAPTEEAPRTDPDAAIVAQREKHRVEAERLENQYKKKFLAAAETTKNVYFPAGSVITDHCDMGGAEKFVAWFNVPTLGVRIAECPTDWEDYAEYLGALAKKWDLEAAKILTAKAMGRA
jgi:hypothetical protein